MVILFACSGCILGSSSNLSTPKPTTNFSPEPTTTATQLPTLEATLLAETSNLLQVTNAKPSWLNRLRPDAGSREPFLQQVCISIETDELWVEGDNEHTVIEKVRSTFQLSINNQIIPLSDSLGILLSFGGYNLFDDKKHLVGQSLGIADICYRVNLSQGVHRATATIGSQKELSYTWAFEVTSTDPYVYATMQQKTNDAYYFALTSQYPSDVK